jgi:DNA invertase Pin-like site-specific DNA recombinase
LIAQWDGIIVSKLDRLGRSVVDFGTLLEWCREHGKTIISVAESLDFSTAAGVMFANALIAFAQFERERMRERRRDAAKQLREAGKWNGGQVAYGYQPKRSGSNWVLVPDAETASVIQEMSGRIIAGQGLSTVARWLNDSHVPTPRKARKAKGIKQAKVYQWWPATVRDVLRSRSLLGEMTHKGGTVLGADGMPIRNEPILSDQTWIELQTALDDARNPLRGERRNPSYLLRIARCACGEPLYITTAGNGTRYYRCRSRVAGTSCRHRMIPQADLEAMFDDWMTSHPAHEIVETVVTPGNDNAKLLAEIGKQIAELTEERYVRGVIREGWHHIMSQLETQYQELAQADVQHSTAEVIGTGRYVSDEWSGWDAQQRRKYLTDAGITFTASRDERGEVHLTPYINRVEWADIRPPRMPATADNA